MGPEFWLYAAVGFAAQLVDGALGIAYGVVSTTVLLANGVPPASASASVHAAKVFTGAASAASHIAHRNVDWRLLALLALGGVVGGVAGTYLLTSVDGEKIKPFVVAWLGLMGLVILYRAWKGARPKPFSWKSPAPLGLVGGFFDAVGGGGWGPTVSSTMVGAGHEPRKAIGTVNTAEFFLTVAVSATFVWALVSGHWEEAGALQNHAAAVGGLVVGGLIAAPFAGLIVKKVPRKVLAYAVGFLLLILAAFQGAQLLKLIG